MFRGWGAGIFGVDDYFTVEDRTSGGYSFPTDLGLTYGLLPGLEIGVDAFLPQAVPTSSLVLNAKYGIPEKDSLPAIAIGGLFYGEREAFARSKRQQRQYRFDPDLG